MTVSELLAWASGSMTARDGLSDPLREARWLLARLLDRPESWTFAHGDAPVDAATAAVFREWVARRDGGEPAHYIVGSCPFWGRDFLVSPGVLIPRPSTEVIVDEVLRLGLTGTPLVLDIATGCGCLAVTFALELPASTVYATDVSLSALAFASTNASRLGASVRFVNADLAGCLVVEADLVVANLPYVPTPHLRLLNPEVRDHEPPVALVSGVDGADLLRSFIPDLHRLLKPGGYALLEMGPGHADFLAPLAISSGLDEITRLSEPGGVERTLILRRPERPTTSP